MPNQFLRATHPRHALRSRYLQLPKHLMVFIAVLCLSVLATNNAYAEGKSCDERWPHAFWDVVSGSCWMCPPSAPTRTARAINGEWACEQPAHKVFMRANGPENPTGLLKTDCRKGWFFDVGHRSCEGGERTLEKVTGPRACSKVVPLVKARAYRLGSRVQ